MICVPCRDGADRMTTLRNIKTPVPLDEITFVLAKSKQSHSECVGSISCVCQHRVNLKPQVGA